jgi:hypothetical protein
MSWRVKPQCCGHFPSVTAVCVVEVWNAATRVFWACKTEKEFKQNKMPLKGINGINQCLNVLNFHRYMFNEICITVSPNKTCTHILHSSVYHSIEPFIWGFEKLHEGYLKIGFISAISSETSTLKSSEHVILCNISTLNSMYVYILIRL